jgi:hypothetical protein
MAYFKKDVYFSRPLDFLHHPLKRLEYPSHHLGPRMRVSFTFLLERADGRSLGYECYYLLIIVFHMTRSC